EESAREIILNTKKICRYSLSSALALNPAGRGFPARDLVSITHLKIHPPPDRRRQNDDVPPRIKIAPRFPIHPHTAHRLVPRHTHPTTPRPPSRPPRSPPRRQINRPIPLPLGNPRPQLIPNHPKPRRRAADRNLLPIFQPFLRRRPGQPQYRLIGVLKHQHPP